MIRLIDQLEQTHALTRVEFKQLLSCTDDAVRSHLFTRARAVQQSIYGIKVYRRGLIEFTNYCKNNCFYCGIRCGNQTAERFRLSAEEILACCSHGYALGFRTFVLQGGEDPHFTDDRVYNLIRAIKTTYPNCALTLSIGERNRSAYEAWFQAGADRYLLRHETATEAHYNTLHPAHMSFQNRMDCLHQLKEIGYQVGCGFMVGSPGQTLDHLVTDLQFLQRFQPHMVGIGPFLPHKDTPFGDAPAGNFALTLTLLAIIRLLLPEVLLPATTALGTIHPQGRELGILAGANVVMPNLSPCEAKQKYTLYNNKLCTGAESADQLAILEEKLKHIGYQLTGARGDSVYSQERIHF